MPIVVIDDVYRNRMFIRFRRVYVFNWTKTPITYNKEDTDYEPSNPNSHKSRPSNPKVTLFLPFWVDHTGLLHLIHVYLDLMNGQNRYAKCHNQKTCFPPDEGYPTPTQKGIVQNADKQRRRETVGQDAEKRPQEMCGKRDGQQARRVVDKGCREHNEISIKDDQEPIAASKLYQPIGKTILKPLEEAPPVSDPTGQ